MSVHSGLLLKNVDEILVGYFPGNKRSYSGGATIKSISQYANNYDLTATNFQLSGTNISLNSTEPTEAVIPNLSANSFSAFTVILSTDSVTKGAFFGAVEGNSLYLPSANQGGESHIPNSIPALSGISITDIGAASTNQSGESHIPISIPALSSVNIVDVCAASTIIAGESHTTIDIPALSAASEPNNTSDSANQGNESHIPNPIPLLETQSAYHLPTKEIQFKVDRGSNALYARYKDGDNDAFVSAPFTLTTKEAFAVVFEKTPLMKVTVYDAGVSIGTLSEGASGTFPSGNIRLFANGDSMDTLYGELGSFMLFGRKLTDSEILKISTSVLSQGAL